MKNQILLLTLVFTILFGLNSCSTSTDDEVAAIKSATNYKVDSRDYHCVGLKYKLDGEKIKMITASIFGMGDGGSRVEFYYSNDKLIFCKVVDSWLVMAEGAEGSADSTDYNYYFENNAITKCISKNKEIKLADIQSYQMPAQITANSDLIIKAYSSKDSAVLCNQE